MKRIGILTSGGDSPGMNAAIRSVVRCGVYRRLKVFGIERGFAGLIEGKVYPLDRRSVSNIVNRGGTILKTGRCHEFEALPGQKKAVETVNKFKLDGLVVIGGDGSFRGAHQLCTKWKVRCIGVPGTIDNDISGTDFTIGADTAVNTALEAIDKIRDTATSLERIFVIEVMGRLSGYIASQVGLAGGAEDIIVPEKSYSIDRMCAEIKRGREKGKLSWIIIVAEGAAKGGELATKINKKTGYEVRATTFGHIQRGGGPTAFDRILASRLGQAAVELLVKGETGKAVGVVNNKINTVSLARATKKRVKAEEKLYRLMRILAM